MAGAATGARAVAALAAAASAETDLIAALRAAAEVPPFQANGPFEADAEILDLGGELVAITVDTLHAGSELATAPTPYDRGWLAATATLSDIGAVGAQPVAMLLSCSFPAGTSGEDAAELGRGARDAARAQGAHVVGGDTNWAAEETLTGCALGLLERGRVLTRIGARAGDVLLGSGPVGSGNVAGVLGLLGEPAGWRPVARCAAGRAVAGIARACIDTSDGYLSAAVMLADLNGLGVELLDAEEVYDPAGVELAARLALPRWLLAAGEWGEYELLVAVDPDAVEECGAALAGAGAAPRRVGRLTAEREFAIAAPGGDRLDALPLLERLRAVEPGASLVERLGELAREVG